MNDSADQHIHPHLVTRRDGAVLRIGIERPQALNALSRSILECLLDQLPIIAADVTIRVLIITGTGRSFVAGADITEYDNATPAEFDDYQSLGRAVFDSIAALPQYTIAAVNGYALGGGFELALCCDEIYAIDTARFGLPEGKLGLLPGGGGTQRLTRAIGARFTKHLLVTGAMIAAPELHRRGLITKLSTTNAELDRDVWTIARHIAACAPLAVRAAPDLVDRGADLPLAQALDTEQAALATLFDTHDAREGIQAFIHKRPPNFIGR